MPKKLTKAEREERDARIERVLANAARTRELAELGQAKLEAEDEAAQLAREAQHKTRPKPR